MNDNNALKHQTMKLWMNEWMNEWCTYWDIALNNTKFHRQMNQGKISSNSTHKNNAKLEKKCEVRREREENLQFVFMELWIS